MHDFACLNVIFYDLVLKLNTNELALHEEGNSDLSSGTRQIIAWENKRLPTELVLY